MEKNRGKLPGGALLWSFQGITKEYMGYELRAALTGGRFKSGWVVGINRI